MRRTFVVATRVDKGDDLNGPARHAEDEAVALNEDLADVAWRTGAGAGRAHSSCQGSRDSLHLEEVEHGFKTSRLSPATRRRAHRDFRPFEFLDTEHDAV